MTTRRSDDAPNPTRSEATALHTPSLALGAGLGRDVLVRRALAVSLVAVATGIGANVSIPLGFTPVPITLQTLAVVGGAVALGPRLGLISMLLYLGLGSLGGRWFAENSGGVDVLLGATGGYLIGFLFAGAITGALIGRAGENAKPGFGRLAIGILAGYGVIFLLGLAWLWVFLRVQGAEIGIDRLLVLGLWPFLPGAVVKAGVTLGLAPALRRAGQGLRW